MHNVSLQIFYLVISFLQGSKLAVVSRILHLKISIWRPYFYTQSSFLTLNFYLKIRIWLPYLYIQSSFLTPKFYIFSFLLFVTFDYKLAGDIKMELNLFFFFFCSKLACMPGEHTMFGAEKMNWIQIIYIRR